jgi:hypothetical protein
MPVAFASSGKDFNEINLTMAVRSGCRVILILMHSSKMLTTTITSHLHEPKELFNDGVSSLYFIKLNRMTINE